MNKLGIFMNFWERDWNASHEKYIKKAADIGFDVLEFQAQPLLEISDHRLRELKKIADGLGIELTYSLGLDPNFDISSGDRSVRRSGIKYLGDIIERIALMGGTLLSGVTYAGWGVPNYMLNDKGDLLNYSIESMRQVLKTAGEYGVTYCIEPVNRYETALINTAEEALAYIALIDSGNIGVLLDTYHMNIEESSVGDAIRRTGDRLVSFHTGENNRTAPGRGHINWDEVFGALKDVGYTGRIICEPFVMTGGEVGRDIKVWRDLIDNPSESRIDAEARYLLDFERKMLKKWGMA